MAMCSQQRPLSRKLLDCTDSKSSPRPLDVPVRLACFPSTLSNVEYLCFRNNQTRDGRQKVFYKYVRWFGLSKRWSFDVHPHAKGKAIVEPGWTLGRRHDLARSQLGFRIDEAIPVLRGRA